jgi:hypothetical protein
VNNASRGVLITGEQPDETAQKDYETLMERVASGEVKGIVLEEPSGDVSSSDRRTMSHPVRKGAMWGAGAGFVLGLVPLLASTLLGAAAGGLMAKASEIRLERGTAPRLRFAKRR